MSVYAAWQHAGGEQWRDEAGRVLALRCEAKDARTRDRLSIFLVSSYAPHSGMTDAESDTHYAALDAVLAHRKPAQRADYWHGC